MPLREFTTEEIDALNVLINLEQVDLIDDNENEFWNTIKRKLNQIGNLK